VGREDTRGDLNGQGRFVRTETLQLRKQMQAYLQKGVWRSRGQPDSTASSLQTLMKGSREILSVERTIRYVTLQVTATICPT
jgi:hypothetical protein